jgi:LPPG:FO 2-phospho-L-lactate transferase
LVSIGTILGVPGIREAVRATAAPVVGLSPIVGDTHVRGMAQQVLTAIGVEVTAGAVARHYGSRRDGGVLDAWLVDSRDEHHVAGVREAGIACTAVPLMMTDDDATAAMAGAAIGLVA